MIENQHSQRKITLKAHLLSATSSIKFSSYFTVLWKSKDSSIAQETTKAEVKQGYANFNQTLTLQLNVPFDQVSKKYSKYQTQMHLRLISKAKQHQQPKLVGKINLQVSTILNHPQNQGATLQYPLQFCSVNAILSLRFQVNYPLKSQSPNIQKSINATPPKSPPTLAFVKLKESHHHIQNERKSEKVSLSTFKRQMVVENTMRQNQKQSISLLYQNKIKELERVCSQQQRQRQVLQKGMSQNVLSLRQLQNELESSKKQNQRLREQLRKKMDQNVKMQLEMSQVRQINSQKTLQIAANNRENNKVSLLTQQVERAEFQKNQLKIKIKELQQTCFQLKTQNTNSEAQLKKSKNEIMVLNSKLESSLRNIQLLQETQSKSQTQSSKQQTLLMRSIQQQRLLRSDLQERLKTLQNQINLLQEKSYELQRTRVSRQQQISEIQAMKAQREERINELESILLTYEEQLRTQRQNNQSLQLKLTRQQNIIQRLQAEKEEAKNIAQAQISDFEQCLQQLRIANENISQELRVFASQKQLQLTLCKNQNSNLSEEIASLKQSYTQSQQQIQNYKSKIAELEEILLLNNEIKARQLSETVACQKQTERKVQEVQQQNRALQNAYKTVQERLAIYETEIAERQSLIERLQEGLSKQMVVNEDKNNKLIVALQKIQNQSENLSSLELQLTQLNELLSLLEANEGKYKNKIGDLELQLYQLLTAHQCLVNKYNQVEIEQERNSLKDSETINQIYGLLNLQRNTSKELKQLLLNRESQITIMSSVIQKLQAEKTRLLLDINQKHQNLLQQKKLKNKVQEQKKRQVQNLQSQVNRLNQNLKARQVHLKQKEDQISKISDERYAIENQLTRARESLEELLTQIQRHKSQEISLNDKTQALKQEAERESNLMSVQLQKWRMRCQELEELLKVTQDEKEREKEQHHQSNLQQQIINTKQMQEIEKYKKQIQNQCNQIKKLKTTINILQTQIKSLNQQLLKSHSEMQNLCTPNEQHNRSPQSQQLQSLIQYKNQQIIELQEEIDRISSEANQAYDLMEQVEAYRQELELHEEERANFETIQNQKNTQIAQLRQQNCKLKEEIVTLTQKNNELEVNLYLLEKSRQEKMEIQSDLQKLEKAQEQHEERLDQDLRLQIADLRLRIKDLEDKNDSLQAQLEDKEQKHVVDLIDQHIRLSKPECTDNNLARSNSRISKQALPDFVQTCQILKQILKNRQGLSFSMDKDESLTSKPQIEDIPRYSRTVSLELQKMKAQLLKGEKRPNISELFRNCENSIKSLCSFVQQCCSYQ